MHILVAIPYRAGTNPHFVERARELAGRLNGRHTYDVQMWENIAPVFSGKYQQNAWARNKMVDLFLKNHDFVFWPDVDIVDYPADLIDQLAPDDGRITAPVTYIEKLPNGGWFYDTGGFIQDGKTTAMYRGIINPQNLDHVPMDAVGCNALIPAWLYRDGLRYWPEGDEVEHVSFCREAAQRGVKSYAAVNVLCYHACLPHYGEAWR